MDVHPHHPDPIRIHPLPDPGRRHLGIRGPRHTNRPIAGSLLSVTTAVTASGQITVISTATLSQVTLRSRRPRPRRCTPGTYYHCLWMQPSTPSALAVFDGNLLIAGAPVP